MFEAQIKPNGPLTVAFMKMRGPYDQAEEGYRLLYQWIHHYGLQPNGMPQAVYVTVPSVTPEEDAEWELWAPIAGGAGKTEPDEAGIGVRRIEADTIASTIHTGPYEELGEVHEQLAAWVAEQGYAIVGPPREVYHSGPEVPAEQTVTEVQVPVERS